jgi:hypothetical protein
MGRLAGMYYPEGYFLWNLLEKVFVFCTISSELGAL